MVIPLPGSTMCAHLTRSVCCSAPTAVLLTQPCETTVPGRYYYRKLENWKSGGRKTLPQSIARNINTYITSYMSQHNYRLRKVLMIFECIPRSHLCVTITMVISPTLITSWMRTTVECEYRGGRWCSLSELFLSIRNATTFHHLWNLKWAILSLVVFVKLHLWSF